MFTPGVFCSAAILVAVIPTQTPLTVLPPVSLHVKCVTIYDAAAQLAKQTGVTITSSPAATRTMKAQRVSGDFDGETLPNSLAALALTAEGVRLTVQNANSGFRFETTKEEPFDTCPPPYVKPPSVATKRMTVNISDARADLALPNLFMSAGAGWLKNCNIGGMISLSAVDTALNEIARQIENRWENVVGNGVGITGIGTIYVTIRSKDRGWRNSNISAHIPPAPFPKACSQVFDRAGASYILDMGLVGDKMVSLDVKNARLEDSIRLLWSSSGFTAPLGLTPDAGVYGICEMADGFRTRPPRQLDTVRCDVNIKNVDVRYALKRVFMYAAQDYTLDPISKGLLVTLKMHNATADQVIKALLKKAGHGLTCTYQDGIYNIGPSNGDESVKR